ncbi:hypothetical protein LTR05_000750 [Lithohypha guttulata]|uniref:Uncharacterized protein n=1 Tax=Lithohypha guttulata TaxID=1690604 RepID=A0AAN7T7X4_9EURO|nr:hypothetical protein LTR05_000750 [Lithohypha guttulata]
MNDSSSGELPAATERRKSFVDMLKPRVFSTSTSSSTSPAGAVPAAPPPPAQRKSSMSMVLGLSGAGNNQESPYNAFTRQRRASISTSSASGSEFRNSFDENAIIEDDDKLPPLNSPPSPSFARRLSFGAQAMREARQSGTSPTNTAGRRPSSYLLSTLTEDSDINHDQKAAPARSPGTAKTGGEGFNWSDAMKNKRASISAGNPFSPAHNRSKSFNVPQPPPPPKEVGLSSPPPAPSVLRSKKPDHLGERMLRGEFMMD